MTNMGMDAGAQDAIQGSEEGELRVLRARVSRLESLLGSIRKKLEAKEKDQELTTTETWVLGQIRRPLQFGRLTHMAHILSALDTPECHGRMCRVVLAGKARNSEGRLVWKAVLCCVVCNQEYLSEEVIG